MLSLFSTKLINTFSLCKSIHNTNSATKEAKHKVFSLSSECSVRDPDSLIAKGGWWWRKWNAKVEHDLSVGGIIKGSGKSIKNLWFGNLKVSFQAFGKICVLYTGTREAEKIWTIACRQLVFQTDYFALVVPQSAFVPPLTHCTGKKVSSAIQLLPPLFPFLLNNQWMAMETSIPSFAFPRTKQPKMSPVQRVQMLCWKALHGYSGISAVCCFKIWADQNGGDNAEIRGHQNVNSSSWGLLTRKQTNEERVLLQ